VLTIGEHTLVKHALGVVERAAKKVARRFPRFVMEPEELYAVGTIELYAAARDFDEAYNHDFADYASRRVRCAMVKAVGADIFQERVKRAVDVATDQFWAYLTDRTYDASRHDEDEARRRFRAVANGMLGAAFMAAVEEAHRGSPESETADQEEYELALRVLRSGLPKLPEPEQRLLVLLYRDLHTQLEASAILSIPYSTLRARHGRALEALRKALLAQGFARAPRPRVLHDAGTVLGAAVATAANDRGPPDET
jgi:RNA polymerase sigma factor (sigma-70 family)